MSSRQLIFLLLPFLLLVVIGFFLYPGRHPSPLAVPSDPLPRSVTFAVVGNDPNLTYEKLAPFVDFLNQFLEDTDLHIRPTIAESNSDLKRALANNEIDFYLDSPFAIYEAVRRGEMRAIARQWRNGQPEYKSLILAKWASPRRSLRDLHMATIAFEDRGSSSAYFLPAAILVQAGYNLVFDEADPETVDGPVVYGRFSGWDKTSVEWLLDEKVDLAAISSVDFAEMDPLLKARVQVVHESENIPRHLLAVRTDLPEDVEDRLLSVLLDLETSPDGRQVLEAFYNTRRFDLIPYENELRQRMVDQITVFPWDP